MRFKIHGDKKIIVAVLILVAIFAYKGKGEFEGKDYRSENPRIKQEVETYKGIHPSFREINGDLLIYKTGLPEKTIVDVSVYKGSLDGDIHLYTEELIVEDGEIIPIRFNEEFNSSEGLHHLIISVRDPMEQEGRIQMLLGENFSNVNDDVKIVNDTGEVEVKEKFSIMIGGF